MSRVFKVAVAALIGLAACAGVQQRFPDDVQAALAHGDMRRLETDRFILYYPAHRRAEIDRFVARAQRCAEAVRDAAVIKRGPWNDKMVIAMPEVAFNNAFVLPGALGYEEMSVIPTLSTLDFTTEFGLLPDPGVVACHELVHYVHLAQVTGFWRFLDEVLGPLYTPQLGADAWFLEGLATHYEAKLAPSRGRPAWPIFTGMFAAAYAGEHINGGDLSSFGRLSPVGHHYLVGTMFVRYLTERYGEAPVWTAIARQARQLTGLFFAGTFKDAIGKSLGDLIDEFDAWHAQTFPARRRPDGQRRLATLGNDARYARGRDGTEAWIADDVDQPTRLVVRGPDGAVLAELGLLDVLPPRTLVDAAPLLVSGLSITADGREVWLTMNDRDLTDNVPRLLRWRRGDSGLTEVASGLGPGATIDPTGGTYYHCAVDGDRWSLAAWDVRRGAKRVLIDAAPGTYVLGAQVSPDGARLIAEVWDGTAFVAWLLDAATGARLGEIRGADTPIWDASFTDDGRAMYLGVVDGRFQVFVDGRQLSDAPYAVLAARGARGTIRFLNREGWSWTLDEIAADAAAPPIAAAAPPPAAAAPAGPAPPPADEAYPATPAAAPAVVSDQPYSAWERFWFPQVRAPLAITLSENAQHYGITLGGGDPLGMQRWSISAHAQPPVSSDDTVHFGGELAYLNTMLAPWQILATAGFLDWVEPITMDGSDLVRTELRQTRDASLSVSRIWRDSLVTTLSGVYTQDIDEPPDQPRADRKLAGPALSLSWLSGEATAYTGLRRALLASASGAIYPQSLSSFTGDIYDVRGELAGVLPLPLGARHTITLQLTGRALVARDDTNLLQVGGFAASGELVSGRSVGTPPPQFDDARFPPNLRFVEYLRGYEDYAITTDRVAIAALSWRYPLIIDRGFASTFGFLPMSYLRQFDLELFATGALDRASNQHASAGGELSMSLVLLRIPLLLGYQVARRLRDDEAITQLLELGAAL
ncbi:MAG TPA: hypothetical protein VK607_24440 [Kofleriaceae bacterium]|nr:hypothetical protein [Kofleriaceae bacterium]